MNARRKILLATGALMMGDALGYLLGPSRYVKAWRGKGRVRWYARMLGWLERHPVLGASIALGEAFAGAAIVRRVEA
jgi:hypothetical protein